MTPEATTTAYDGIVYVFSREHGASNALRQMSDSKITKPLVSRHPGGIHVMYIDADTGTLKLLTDVSAVPVGSSVSTGSPTP